MLPPNIEDINLPPVNLPPVVTPTVDPNFASGFNYARSIAGGLPMEQVIAPGVSFSPEQPGGFTQAQLGPVMTDMANIVTDAPPDMPFSDADAPDYGNLPPNIIGGGMGDNITILQDQMRFPPPIDILGGFNFVPQINLPQVDLPFRDEISKDKGSILPPPQIGMVFDPVTRKMIPNPLGDPDMSGKIIGNNAREQIPPEDFGFGPGIRRSEDFFIPEELMRPPAINVPPPVTPPPVISKKMPPILLEDFGFGPGIRRTEDFFTPEELMMPGLNIPENVTKKDINEALLQIDTPPVINTPDITQGLFNLQAPQVPIVQTPQVSSGGRFLRQDMTPSLFR